MASPTQSPIPGAAPIVVDASSLLPLAFGFAPNRIVSAAIQLGVFSGIAAGQSTAAALAGAIGANARALRMLLDALVGMGLLAKVNDGYALTEVAQRHMLPSSPDYMGTMFETDHIWDSWSGLTEVIRYGQSHIDLASNDEAENFFPRLVRSLHVGSQAPARRAAQVLVGGTERAAVDVIDIGCGSGVWGIAVAEAAPSARLTLLDSPAVLDAVARDMMARNGLDKRTRFIAGSYHELDLGSAEYDLAILGNIIHLEGDAATRRLFGQAARALRPGGRLAIIDMFPNDARTGPFFPLMFALNMLVRTQAGDTYTVAELRPWLAEAGFAVVETFDIGHHSPLLVAQK